MRIAIGGIEHESSNYSTVETPLEAFYGHARSKGAEELLQRSGEVNTIIDGFIKELRRQKVEMVPLVWRHAPSGNQPTRDTHQALKETLLAPLRQALPVDGVLLSVHGAYSAQGIDDADGDILQSVRQLVGPRCPVIAVHDLHCNIGKTMVDNATALIVEDTYPHVDMAERGMEAARMMVRTVRGEIRPTLAWRSIPLFWAAAKMITAEEPMSLVIDRLHDLESQPGVLTASVGVGYQWADVNCAGSIHPGRNRQRSGGSPAKGRRSGPLDLGAEGDLAAPPALTQSGAGSGRGPGEVSHNPGRPGRQPGRRRAQRQHRDSASLPRAAVAGCGPTPYRRPGNRQDGSPGRCRKAGRP